MEEADILLKIAHAKRDTQRAAKELADNQLRESQLQIDLRQLRARCAEKSWGDSEVNIGRVILTLEELGFSVFPPPPSSRMFNDLSTKSSPSHKIILPTLAAGLSDSSFETASLCVRLD